MAVCFCDNSNTSCGIWRHFKSGLRRSVPRPVHGASTNTRSNLPFKRFNLGSFSLVITCACKLDSPERLRRLPKLFKRLSEISNAYKRPVLRIKAPNAKVFPPAPAQKSATIMPRFGATKCAKIWLPSSCTSILPSVNKM